MIELKVIDGVKKEKPDYRKLYADAFIRTLKNTKEEADDLDKISLDARKKVIWYGVKYINATNVEEFDYYLLNNTFNLISSIVRIMGGLTPREFQNIFPIDKDYDGERYQFKDYFYTKNYIEDFGEDRVIGEETKKFLWEYMNAEVRRFEMQSFCVMSAIRRAEGEKGIMEEFLEEQGVTTHTLTEDSNGNKFLTNNDTGEVRKVKKRRPRHLRVVK